MAIIDTLPVIIANGTTADATQVMADLNYIVTRVNNNAAPNNGLPGNAALLSQANVFTAVQTGIDGNALTAFPTIQQIQKEGLVWGGTSGGTNTATITVSPAPLALVAGHSFRFIAGGSNTGAVTLNVNGLGAVAVVKVAGGGAVALAPGDIIASQVVTVVYDGTQFWLTPQFPYTHGADIASAGTVNLSTATGDFVRVTGTTTITAITLTEGAKSTVFFTGSLVLTNGASLVLPGGNNIITASGDIAIFRGYSGGVVYCEAYTRASGTAVVASPLRNYIDGFIMSNDGGSPNTVIDVGSGQCTDSTNAVTITGAALTKNQNSWASGSAAGGKLSAAAMANATWYYFFVLYNPTTGAVDYGFDVASTPTATLISGYTYYRRIGMARTQAASTNWMLFEQDGDNFYWSSPQAEQTNTGKSATASTLTLQWVPAVTVRWYGNLLFTVSSNGFSLLTPTDAADVAPAVNATLTFSRLNPSGANFTGYVKCIAQQLRIRFDETGNNYWLTTLGWVDQRGKNS